MRQVQRYVLHYTAWVCLTLLTNYTGPRTRLGIPQKATEETHEFERYHKAVESLGPGQES